MYFDDNLSVQAEIDHDKVSMACNVTLISTFTGVSQDTGNLNNRRQSR